MTVDTILAALVRVNLVASVAILLVLVLRPLALRWVGASIAYRLWLVVPIAAAASFLPARAHVVVVPPPQIAVDPNNLPAEVKAAMTTLEAPSDHVAAAPLSSVPALPDVLIVVWLLGAGALIVRSVVITRRLAADRSVGPALIGVLRPRLILPVDFETRFDTEERLLILAHEEIHRRSGHMIVNGLVEVARCLSWFNPLVHWAAIPFRTDQELACDAAVIARHPAKRRAYAEALLKSQIATAFMPLGCTWTSRSAKRIGERIAMLGQPSIGRRGAIASLTAISLVSAGLGYAAWAQQPERLVAQVAGSDAPAGLLSPIERMRHERAMKQAKAGNIDVVFFGSSDTEFWLWKDRGLSVWKKALAPYHADSFGAQGASTLSILWRLRHGELDGYKAKVMVLDTVGVVDQGRGRSVDDIVKSNADIVAEIRKRQPQAKILIFANVRALQPTLWKMAHVNAGVAKLADNKTVFFIDMTDRFRTNSWAPFASIDSNMYSLGMQKPGFEVWAEELKPWLERFAR